MKLARKLKNLVEKLTDFDYDAIASLLSNDELSTDKELIDLIDKETDSKMDKRKLANLLKSERNNFMNFKYKTDKQGKEVIKKYLG